MKNTKKKQQMKKYLYSYKGQQEMKKTAYTHTEQVSQNKTNKYKKMRKAKKKQQQQSQIKEKVSQLRKYIKVDSQISSSYSSCFQSINSDSKHQKTCVIHPPNNYLLQLIKCNKCIKFLQNNIVYGSLGHNCLYFNKPIFEGYYYIQYKLMRDDIPNFIQKKQIKNLYSSSIRVGICGLQYNFNLPLGLADSLGYKIDTGQIIINGTPKKYECSIGQDDVIGVGVHIPVVVKNKSQKISKNSSLAIYRNGQKVVKIKDRIKEKLYRFAVSIYNFGKVQIRIEQKDQKFRPKKYLPFDVNIKNVILEKQLKQYDVLI